MSHIFHFLSECTTKCCTDGGSNDESEKICIGQYIVMVTLCRNEKPYLNKKYTTGAFELKTTRTMNFQTVKQPCPL